MAHNKKIFEEATLALHPTQFAIGLFQIEAKVRELKKLSRKGVREFIDDHVVPAVRSPWKDLYIVDHHHHLFTCWHADIKKVKVEIIRDLSGRKLSWLGFWNDMKKRNHAYLYDQFGEGPRNPLYLSNDIRGMADDPYRSLAWVVCKSGGFEKSEKTFAEFEWADFFRRHKLLEREGRNGINRMLKRALKLACSPAARNLPGYIGGR